MLSIGSVILVLCAHYWADFYCQTHWQASNKSKNNLALGAHVGTYTLIMMLAGSIIFGNWTGILWAVINGAFHFGTDYVTSRMTSRLWAKQEWHDFFVTVGADQLIHYFTLFITLVLMLP